LSNRKRIKKYIGWLRDSINSKRLNTTEFPRAKLPCNYTSKAYTMQHINAHEGGREKEQKMD